MHFKMIVIFSQTGDNAPHSPWNETLQSQLAVSRMVSQIITEEMPGVPVYAAIGNHGKPAKIMKLFLK